MVTLEGQMSVGEFRADVAEFQEVGVAACEEDTQIWDFLGPGAQVPSISAANPPTAPPASALRIASQCGSQRRSVRGRRRRAGWADARCPETSRPNAWGCLERWCHPNAFHCERHPCDAGAHIHHHPSLLRCGVGKQPSAPPRHSPPGPVPVLSGAVTSVGGVGSPGRKTMASGNAEAHGSKSPLPVTITRSCSPSVDLAIGGLCRGGRPGQIPVELRLRQVVEASPFGPGVAHVEIFGASRPNGRIP